MVKAMDLAKETEKDLETDSDSVKVMG